MPAITLSEDFTLTSALSLGAVATIGLVAYVGSKVLLPTHAKWEDRFTFVWLVLVFLCLLLWFSKYTRCTDF
jgi:hypothetical protein